MILKIRVCGTRWCTNKVYNAIIAVLDMYFACKCDEIDKLGMTMKAHLNVSWILKKAIMSEDYRGK